MTPPIVGVARAGLPIAVAFSYLVPNARLAILERTEPRGEKLPFYDFDAGRSEWREQLNATLALNSSLANAKRIIIVDDVATYAPISVGGVGRGGAQ